MSIKLINRTQDPFVIVNKGIFMNRKLSLRDRGMMATLMSLPSGWEFSINGMAAILPDGRDCVGNSIRNLESMGYLIREQIKNPQGKFDGARLIINTGQGNGPMQENPMTEKPSADKPSAGEPSLGNTPQYNNKVINNQKDKNNISINHQSENEQLSQEEVRDMIHYDVVASDRPNDIVLLDTIVNLLTETLCSSKKVIKILGEEIPSETVKNRLKRLNFSNIEYVIDSIKEEKNKIHNPRAYLLTSLYNAPDYENLHWINKAMSTLYGGDD